MSAVCQAFVLKANSVGEYEVSPPEN